MTKTVISRWLVAALSAVALTACSGDRGRAGADGQDGQNGQDGQDGATGPQGPAGAVTLTAESCSVCHGGSALAAMNPLHDGFVPQHYTATIDSVTIPNAATTGGQPTVVFTVKDAAGNPVAGLKWLSFEIAKLVPDTAHAGSTMWKSYLNTTEDGVKIGTYEGKRESPAPGVLTEGPTGTYTYAFVSDLSRTDSTGNNKNTEAYEPNATTRFVVQNNINYEEGSTSLPFNAWLDFVPATNERPATDPRALATTAACNGCHQQLYGMHGNKRFALEQCVVCHNPSMEDPTFPVGSGAPSLDMSVLTHKIHMGRNLPSVLAGGTYVANGTDFTGVGFPQDPGNCTVCHDGNSTSAAKDDWKNKANLAACQACHDRTSFVALTAEQIAAGWTMHTAGVQADASCALCHTAADITANHAFGSTRASKFAYTIVSVTNTAPGQKPVITFKVTDPTNADAAYDIKTNAAFTASGARLAIDLAWSTVDYTNAGSGATPGQPVSIDARANAVANADGTYAVTSTLAIPADATGSGVAALEGHPNDASGAIPVKSVVKYFAITDTAPVARRAVVSDAKCNACHSKLVFHGSNRNGSVEVCVICHNSESTDISQRPATGSVDGKAEASIDFKTLIHAIHDGASTQLVIYGYGKNPVDYGEVTYPTSLANCTVCHVSDPSIDFPAVNGTTTSTAGDPSDPAAFLRTTRRAAVCSSCHGTTDAIAHMQQNGGQLGFTQAEIDALIP